MFFNYESVRGPRYGILNCYNNTKYFQGLQGKLFDNLFIILLYWLSPCMTLFVDVVMQAIESGVCIVSYIL